MVLDINKSSIPLFLPEDRLALLNDIDTFRKDGLANLPQIVVCGDTSSGKSSVLEALSGIPFPMDSTICTRFATEIALRYSSNEAVTGEASISPGPRPSESHEHHVKSFKETVTSLEDIPGIMQRAKSTMGIGEVEGISRDVLHLKLNGRSLPNLTLVDLPGLIHSAQDRDDIAKVEGLVEYYFKQEESLILIVFSAENALPNQGILSLSQRFDPSGERSIGVITKPDILQRPDKAGMVPTVLELAQNKHPSFKFKRPWQIMRCLTDDERQRGANRVEIETTLFSQEPWESFDKRRLGTPSLRSVLCEYLQEHILRSLPDLVKSLEGKIASVKSSLQELGPPRATQEEHMQYLIRISRRYEQLARAALNGDYSDSFFDQHKAGKRLRAKTMALTDDFESAMRLRGHMFEVAFFPSNQGSSDEPERIGMGDALLKVGKLIEGYRGPELPITFNPRLIGELFKEQSQKWPKFALEYAAAICHAVEVFLRKVVDSICPSPGRAREFLLRDVFQDAVYEYQSKLNEKILELFAPYTSLFLFCTKIRLQQSLTRVQINHEVWAKADILPKDRASSTFAFGNVENPTSDQDARLNALQLSRAYYNVALETFIENVVVLGVESCLLSKLEEMFSPETVARMTTDKLQLFGGETPEIIAERTHLENRLQNLEDALKNCRRHASREFGLDPSGGPETSQQGASQPSHNNSGREQLSSSPMLANVNGKLTPGNPGAMIPPQTQPQQTIPNSAEKPEIASSASPKLSSIHLEVPNADDKNGQPSSTDSGTQRKVYQPQAPKVPSEADVKVATDKSKSSPSSAASPFTGGGGFGSSLSKNQTSAFEIPSYTRSTGLFSFSLGAEPNEPPTSKPSVGTKPPFGSAL